jgi:alkylation response protein AidB-like acyl-CoA dehydrogenase
LVLVWISLFFLRSLFLSDFVRFAKMLRRTISRFPFTALSSSALVSSRVLPKQFSTHGAHPDLLTLSEEETMMVKSVSQFAASRIAPVVREMDEKQLMQPELIKDIFDQGLMGIEVPTEYGGAGMSFSAGILVIEELAKVDPSVGVMVDVQNTLVNNVFLRWANEEQKQKYLPRLATDSLACFCLSEAGSGSDAFALRTRADLDGDHYVLNGAKLWITNSYEASIYLVMANVDFSLKHRGITCFVVERENPGLTLGKKENKLGIRASSTCEVVLENCRVHKDAILGKVGDGYKVAMATLNEGRIGIGAQMIGLAQGAFDLAFQHGSSRKQFGQFIGEFQGMQHQYGQAATEIMAARLLVYNAARRKDAGLPFTKEAAMAKLKASQVAEQVSSKAVEWMGGLGFTKDLLAEKYFRDSKIGAIYEGTSNIQLTTITKLLQAEYK